MASKAGALTIVDGVCATAAETMRMEDWGIDLALTASQKAIGVPPGLAIVVASARAMETWKKRKTKVGSYYLDFAEWLPIHEAYEAEKPSYFATPPVNLITALDVSLGQILDEGMDARFARNARIADAFRAAWSALGLRMVAESPANTLSALYYPEGIDASLVGKIRQQGIVVAGGLHPALKTKYFRVGHMGAITPADVLATVGAIERALGKKGEAVAAAQSRL
jgi:alanine-glyoxylate transaminase/serine-glyoxylate transaminase/serine-pyruvate transaminase